MNDFTEVIFKISDKYGNKFYDDLPIEAQVILIDAYIGEKRNKSDGYLTFDIEVSIPPGFGMRMIFDMQSNDVQTNTTALDILQRGLMKYTTINVSEYYDDFIESTKKDKAGDPEEEAYFNIDEIIDGKRG